MPTPIAPAAYPTACAFARIAPAYTPAPRKAKGCGPARCLAAMLTGKPPKARAAWLAANYARHLTGRPLLWPSA